MVSEKKNPQRELDVHSLLPLLGNRQKPKALPKQEDNIKLLLEHKRLSSPAAITEEEERKRLSQEIHDGIGQILTTIGLQVTQCLNGYDQTSSQSLQQHKVSLEQLSLLVREAIGEVRTICRSIRPAILDDLGVIAAISWQCRQISRATPELVVVTNFDIEEEQIPVGHRSAIYRIVQESLNNALKYAQASQIGVSLSLQDELIHLSIIDNGIGLDLASIRESLGIGLISMRERAASIHGKLEIDAAIGEGVEIRALFPTGAIAP
ncbi:MAG: sensor histidine kinase [Candidatus Thiodiazotropha sp.]|nr:sensor histidine kinase [Candidatus Thiodiazotropha taylori]MBT3058202.1 sensor histidine kinase [Candidatus Thiodiazotropha sp. (ex Lucina pensylvanica)]MBV2094506.1 sensor histidine kinase [Candidatus Thiodiazotropha sp. (ex Codakia orbicularis)]PUB75704.1 MAG: hypothetical protein DBP03_06105 [gamma proteobacterium symbiont of Ctena orbiculata]MBT3062806.1 sensor histidine kinase [Candidatus Thiodiazotropha sp. (ex Lucina pensylvanica)]